MRFLTWFSFKKFRYNITKWMFPIIIAFLGLLLINTMLAVALVGQNLIQINFIENSNIKLLKVDPDRTTEKISLDFIERNKNPNIVLFPYIKEINVNLPVSKKGNNELLPSPGIPLPYEALEILGIENVDKEEWDQGKVMIISQEYASAYNLSVDDEVTLRLAKTEYLEDIGAAMQPDEFQEYIVNLTKELNERPIRVIQINEIPLIKFKGDGIIPLNLYYEFNAKIANVSKEKFIKTADSENGMGVLVKEFSDVENEAKNFINRNYSVEYSLAEFENLSTIIEYVYYGLIVLVLFISIIVIITIINCIIQLFLFQRREIGILLSMGIPKIKIINSYFYELFLTDIFVILLEIPCIYIIIHMGQKALLELLPNNTERVSYWPLFGGIIVLNIILLYIISLVGAVFPMVKMFNKKINDLIIND